LKKFKLCRRRIEYLEIAVIVSINFSLQLVALSKAGYSGDQPYFMDGGRHLSFGYMDFGPIIGFFASGFFISQRLLLKSDFLMRAIPCRISHFFNIFEKKFYQIITM
jgi:hypothetical protein